MSKLVKLITESEFKKGQTNILPDVGVVTFDQDGVIEVPEEFAQSLVDIYPDLDFFDPNVQVKAEVEEEDLSKKTEEEDLSKSDDDDKIAPKVEESEVLGATEVASDVKVEEEIVEEQVTQSDTEASKPDATEIASELEKKSAAELKELVKQFDETQLETLKNKKEYIKFLVEQLTK